MRVSTFLLFKIFKYSADSTYAHRATWKASMTEILVDKKNTRRKTKGEKNNKCIEYCATRIASLGTF